ncbi:MAG: M20/M25/M40 family metallo-hydrolase [Saprospiraceae bacterium]|nr:M20/M25/M40 family metallo-hydrolase [Saprospiraceae bacterium]
MPISESRLEQLTELAVQLLLDLTAIPAYSKAENNKAQKLVEQLTSYGLFPGRLLNNVILTDNNVGEKPVLLLNSHIDTVKPVASWTMDPHQPILKDDKLFGLGSNDAGASVVCLIMAYLHLSKKTQPYHLILAATAEEEISGYQGILHVLDHIAAIDFAIVGEPTNMQMAVAEKGLMVIDAVARGVAGHAAREEGINAIYEALNDIDLIRKCRFEKISDYLGETMATVTLIHAGTQHNVVPDHCEYVIDVRSNELYTNQEIYEILQNRVKSKLTPRSFRLQSSSISLDHPAVLRGNSIGLTPYGSPTLSDQALMVNPSLKIGPGLSSRSHTANEFIEVNELRQGIKIYIELLDELEL